MKQTDLRLSNSVVYPKWHRDGSDRLFTIRELYLKDNKVGLTDGIIQTEVSFDCIKPIPISKDLLISAGGVLQPKDCDDSESLKLKIGRFTFWADDSNDFKTLECEHFPKIKYAHKLQNLYFELTNGKEIKFKK